MQAWQRVLYWLITGALVGFGLAALASIGYPFFLIGGILFFFGVFAVGRQGFWAAVVGFGTLPAFLIVYGERLYGGCPTTDWSSRGFLPVVVDNSNHFVPCGAIHEAQFLIAAGFAAVALVGGVWGIILALRK